MAQAFSVNANLSCRPSAIWKHDPGFGVIADYAFSYWNL